MGIEEKEELMDLDKLKSSLMKRVAVREKEEKGYHNKKKQKKKKYSQKRMKGRRKWKKMVKRMEMEKMI